MNQVVHLAVITGKRVAFRTASTIPAAAGKSTLFSITSDGLLTSSGLYSFNSFCRHLMTITSHHITSCECTRAAHDRKHVHRDAHTTANQHAHVCAHAFIQRRRGGNNREQTSSRRNTHLHTITPSHSCAPGACVHKTCAHSNKHTTALMHDKESTRYWHCQ